MNFVPDVLIQNLNNRGGIKISKPSLRNQKELTFIFAIVADVLKFLVNEYSWN